MVQKFSLKHAVFTPSPGQEADIFAANLVDQHHGGPITVGYGKYAPNQELGETLAVTDVMFIVEGSLSVSTQSDAVTAGPGEIVYMPKGEAVIIRSGESGAITAYVTYPHWQEHLSEAG
jgi:ethanolamine utilization protein EutQ (cupin superfamily)